MTKQEAWRQATERLRTAGVLAARWQAELLLRGALGETRARFLASLDESADPPRLERFWDYVSRREQGTPVQYLLGSQEFMGLQLQVNPAVLIPRPDTEILVEQALRCLQGKAHPLVLDLATGSGAVALALAHHAPKARVLATDISEAALQVARANAARLGLLSRVTFRQGSWLEPLPPGQHFDVIASNPPYIPSADIAELSPEVQQEPHLALDGGADGLNCYRSLIPSAVRVLKPGGSLLLEIGQGQADAVLDLLRGAGLLQLQTIPDLAGIDRVVRGQTAELGEGSGGPAGGSG